MSIFVLGIDLGKNVCSLVGLDAAGAVVLRRRLRRDGVVDFIGKMAPCIVVMCPFAHSDRCSRVGNDEAFLPDLASRIDW